MELIIPYSSLVSRTPVLLPFLLGPGLCCRPAILTTWVLRVCPLASSISSALGTAGSTAPPDLSHNWNSLSHCLFYTKHLSYHQAGLLTHQPQIQSISKSVDSDFQDILHVSVSSLLPSRISP